MTKKTIYVGTAANDGTGDDLRSAFQKVNDNFDELYIIANTNSTTAETVGAGEGIYKTKVGTSLKFKSIVAGTGITLTPGTDTLTVSSTISAPNTIGKIVASGGGEFNINLPNQTLNVVGQGSTVASISGSTLYLSTSFTISDDQTPTLGGDLNLDGYNIIGPGDVGTLANKIDSLYVNDIYVGTSLVQPGSVTVNGPITVYGNTQLAAVASGNITSSGTITAPNLVATTGISGLLTGSVNGNLRGNIYSDYDAQVKVLDTSGPNASFTGNVIGTLSGGFTGTLESPGLDLNGNDIFGQGKMELTGEFLSNVNPLIVNASFFQSSLDPLLYGPRLIDGANCAVFTVPNQQDYGFTESIRLRSLQVNGTQTLNVGTGIMFESVNTITDPLLPGLAPEYVFHGKAAIQTYTDPTFSDFVVQVRTADGLNTTSDVLIVSGNNQVHASGLSFNIGTISNRTSNIIDNVNTPVDIDVNLTTFTSTGKLVGMYLGGLATEGYKFPRERGVTGQVLTVPLTGNTLEWTTPAGGGGGGGVSYFASLLDGPGGYVAGSAGKLVRVKSTEDGLEFASNVTANVTGDLTGNASTATKLYTARTINGLSFDGTANITLVTDDIQEDGTPVNLWFTDARARSAINVAPALSLTYNSVTGEFNLAEDAAATASTLALRDASGGVTATTAYVDNLEGRVADITVNSTLNGAFDITTTGTISANNFVTTGTGDPTIQSAGSIVLDPTTYTDASLKRIVNVGTPTDNGDATTKLYVDTAVTAVSTASITQIPVTADLGGVKNIQKNATLNFVGGTNINTVSGTNSITINLDTELQNISVRGDLNVTAQGVGTGNVIAGAGYVKGGNVKIGGNAVTQTVSGQNLNLEPGTGGYVSVTGQFNLELGTYSVTGFDTITIPANSTPSDIDITTNVTFIRTLDWTGAEAALAYATIANGRDGQIKTIIIETRGVYGDALDTRPRHVVLNGNIEGASRSITIGATATTNNASATFIFLNNYWWRTARVD